MIPPRHDSTFISMCTGSDGIMTSVSQVIDAFNCRSYLKKFCGTRPSAPTRGFSNAAASRLDSQKHVHWQRRHPPNDVSRAAQGTPILFCECKVKNVSKHGLCGLLARHSCNDRVGSETMGHCAESYAAQSSTLYRCKHSARMVSVANAH